MWTHLFVIFPRLRSRSALTAKIISPNFPCCLTRRKSRTRSFKSWRSYNRISRCHREACSLSPCPSSWSSLVAARAHSSYVGAASISARNILFLLALVSTASFHAFMHCLELYAIAKPPAQTSSKNIEPYNAHLHARD